MRASRSRHDVDASRATQPDLNGATRNVPLLRVLAASMG
jgi:hypothetical protein